MPHVHLITFGDGSPDYQNAANRLLNASQAFSSIHSREAFRLNNLGKDYDYIFSKSVRENQRGLGLFSWKPFLINKKLNEINQNDILIYMDSGCEINPHGEPRFNDYLSITSEKEALTFEMPHPQRYWTKRHPILTDLHIEHHFRNQIAATIIFLKKTDRISKFCSDWLSISSYKGGETLIDPTPDEIQMEGFQAHRHDQSTFSLAAFINNIHHITDETYFESWSDGINFPILALRNRTGNQEHHKYFGYSQKIKDSIRKIKNNYRLRRIISNNKKTYLSKN